MKSDSRTRSQRKRRGSYAPDIALGFFIFAIVASIALLIYAKPFPNLFTHKSSQSSDSSVQVQPAEVQQTGVPTQPVNSGPPPTLPPGSIYLANPRQPITIASVTEHRVNLVLIEGGVLGTRRSPLRQGVADFVRQAGATAGINGTFFANASLRGTDNLLIGPSLCDNESIETLSPFDTKPQLQGRPLVVISPTGTCIIPYDTVSLSQPGAIQNLFTGVTNAFLGGVWLVKGGVASTLDQLNSYNVKDAEDPRRRAFFALMPDGRPVLGAVDGSVTSRELARALADAGVDEAVLLDSGFSTSLVFQDTILVAGHSTRTVPSRPVPHALVLYGQPDPSAVAAAAAIAPPLPPEAIDGTTTTPATLNGSVQPAAPAPTIPST